MALFDWFNKNVEIPKNPSELIIPIRKENIIFFKGKDGGDYDTPEALLEANQRWMREHYKFKAMDGTMHSDWKDVEEANLRWMREHYKYKAIDGSMHSDWKDVEEANKIYMQIMFRTAQDLYNQENKK